MSETTPDATTPAPEAPAEPQAPAAAQPEPAAKKSLEDSLTSLDDETRQFVLTQVRSARTEAQNLRGRLKEAEPKLAEYDRLVEAGKTELERAQEAATQAAERITVLTGRAVKAEIKALAADTFADPSDAAAFLDTSKYAGDDGEVNTEAITTDLAELLARKPHLAKPTRPGVPAPNPAQGSSANGSPSIDQQIAEALAKGDVQTSMRLKAQKLAQVKTN